VTENWRSAAASSLPPYDGTTASTPPASIRAGRSAFRLPFASSTRVVPAKPSPDWRTRHKVVYASHGVPVASALPPAALPFSTVHQPETPTRPQPLPLLPPVLAPPNPLSSLPRFSLDLRLDFFLLAASMFRPPLSPC
jgi:hypothetical protein